MQSVARLLGSGTIRGILAMAVASLFSAAVVLRLLVTFQGPSFPSLPLTWSTTPEPLYAAAAAAERALSPSPAQAVNQVNSSATDEELDGEEYESMGQTVVLWKFLKSVMHRKDLFSEARDKVPDSLTAWRQLRRSIKEQRNNNASKCPYSVSCFNATDLSSRDGLLLHIPCGLVLDSSITLLGLPLGEEFRVDFIGHKVPGDAQPPVIFHHNVRLRGDRLSEHTPVIVQNSWTPATDWAFEERCPPQQQQHDSSFNKTVDNLAMCAAQVGSKDASSSATASVKRPPKRDKTWFPYAQGLPFAATVWVGWDGFHVTVDGKHITSFEYRQNLEPWMVGGVNLAGSLHLNSVIANGLPTSDSQLGDLETLQAPPLLDTLDMFIGVVSTANNFERRMAVRRSWMQYEAVRSGKVAVRFFLGLHQNQQVNVELWKEAMAYGDIQLLPFVDYYNLITLKTLAICIFATKLVKTQYVMKTDDDTFVRVDQVVSSVMLTKQRRPLLYGLIETTSKPNRDVYSKWYITAEEWALPQYPPWAHGPGYVFSSDIAQFVVNMNEAMKLKLFKLEDVAMGAWIEEYSKLHKKNISYVSDATFLSDGCRTGYTIAHYQNPRQMLCLWQQLGHGSGPVCC